MEKHDMVKINNEELKALAVTYNSQGKTALYAEMRQKYGVRNVTTTLRRMKHASELGYDPVSDHFSLTDMNHDDEVFLSMEELCGNSTIKAPQQTEEKKPEKMQKLIQELIGDKLLELNRYIKIDSSERRIMIDQTSLESDGYQMIMH